MMLEEGTSIICHSFITLFRFVSAGRLILVNKIGSFIDVKCSTEAILLRAKLGIVPWNGQDYSGMCSYNLGNGISAAVTYQDDGFRVDVVYTLDGMDETGTMILYVKQLELPALTDVNEIYSIQPYDMWQVVNVS